MRLKNRWARAYADFEICVCACGSTYCSYTQLGAIFKEHPLGTPGYYGVRCLNTVPSVLLKFLYTRSPTGTCAFQPKISCGTTQNIEQLKWFAHDRPKKSVNNTIEMPPTFENFYNGSERKNFTTECMPVFGSKICICRKEALIMS